MLRSVLAALAVLGMAGIGYAYALLPWHVRWGATKKDARMALQGDDIVPEPRMASTRAVSIQAPASDVWPWLVQMGQGRGGLYSYDWLENLIGCDIHSADQILPEHQHLEVGDVICMGPEGYPFYTVEAITPGKALVLRAGDPKTKQPGPGTWLLALQERGDGTTRLLSRQRSDYEPTAVNHVMWRGFVEPASFVMEQKMLRGVKERAEARAIQHQ